MQDQWSGAQRPSFMGGQGAYKPGEGQNQKYTKEGAAAMRTGGSGGNNQEAANNLRAMLYKDGEKPTTVSSLSLLYMSV